MLTHHLILEYSLYDLLSVSSNKSSRDVIMDNHDVFRSPVVYSVNAADGPAH